MKIQFQNGQSTTEYLMGLAGVVIVTISGLRLFHDAIENQWSTLVTWLIFPNP